MKLDHDHPKVSRKRAIELFRKQWRKMGKYGLSKDEAFSPTDFTPRHFCWLCQWKVEGGGNRRCCPIRWTKLSEANFCCGAKALFTKWVRLFYSKKVEEANKIAKLIAELPEVKVSRRKKSINVH